MSNKDNVVKFVEATKEMNWQEKLRYIAGFDDVVFSTSFSLEDQIITDFIAKNNLNIEIFTIDTGRLFEQTYKVWQETLHRYYKTKIKTFYPETNLLEEFVTKNGVNSFYDSKDLRLTCCSIRKVEPLGRALNGKKIWISGIRAEHSSNRADKGFFEMDEGRDIVKFYPLFDFSMDEVWAEIEQKKIPFNALYKEGFSSIGCAPCTRKIEVGEDLRAGRWWWENDEKKECGLHSKNRPVKV